MQPCLAPAGRAIVTVQHALPACTCPTLVPISVATATHSHGAQLASLTTWTDEALIALDTLTDRASSLVSPSLRLGVTGLSRAGKTVFITALVHNLVHGGRLPLFEAYKSGRIAARPSRTPARRRRCRAFSTKTTSHALVDDRVWPEFDTRHLRTAADDRV